MRLKDVATVIVSNVDKKSVDGEMPVRVCNYVDVYYQDRIGPDLPFLNATATPAQVEAFGLRGGEVLITKDSEVAEDIAVPALVPARLEGVVCGYHLAVIRSADTVDPAFLFWVLASDRSRSYFAAEASGVTRFGLRTDSIKNLPVDLPAIEEQRRIADFLDAETARIDTLIAKRHRQIELLKSRSVTAINSAFDGDWQRRVDGVPFGIEGHRCVRLGALAQVQSGLTLDGGREAEPSSAEYPYLRVANVHDGSLDLADVKSVVVPKRLAVRCLLQSGDVLMTEGGDPDKLGRGAVWAGELGTCLHQNHVFAVRPDRSRLLPEYLALVTRTLYARAYFETTAAKSTGIASTSAVKIASFRVPLPAVQDQDLILRAVGQALEDSGGATASLTRQIELLEERRQALITAAVTGAMTTP